MPTDFAAIHRDAATKNATLVIKKEEPWKVYAGRNAACIDFSTPIAAGNSAGRFPVSAPSSWSCFAIETSAGAHYVAERHLPMVGGYNFRDLGGFRGADGKRTAWGTFFRTDDMHNLTEDDLAYLASIPVCTVVDFRTEAEREQAPDKLPPTAQNAMHMPIVPGRLDSLTAHQDAAENPDEFMLSIYQDLVLDPGILAVYKDFFAIVQNEESIPLAFHCAAGKDRTGFAAALILHALGVDEETIFADYEASNIYLGDKYAPLLGDSPQKNGLYTVKREFLAEALRLVVEHYDSVDAYLARALDVDIPRMRNLYLT